MKMIMNGLVEWLTSELAKVDETVCINMIFLNRKQSTILYVFYKKTSAEPEITLQFTN